MSLRTLYVDYQTLGGAPRSRLRGRLRAIYEALRTWPYELLVTHSMDEDDA